MFSAVQYRSTYANEIPDDSAYVLTILISPFDVPDTYEGIFGCPDNAVIDKINSHKQNDRWRLVERAEHATQ